MSETRAVTIIPPWDRVPPDRGNWPARGNFRLDDDPWAGGEIRIESELDYQLPINYSNTLNVPLGFAYLVASFITYNAMYRVAGFYISSAFVLALIVVISVVYAFRQEHQAGHFQLPAERWQFVYRLCLGVAVFFKIQLVRLLAEYHWFAAFVLVVTVCLMLLLADCIAVNFIHAVTGHHRLPTSTRDEYRRAFAKRFQNLRYFRARAAQAIPTYWVGFLLPAASLYITSLLAYHYFLTTPESPYVAMYAVLFFTIIQASLSVVLICLQPKEAWAINPFRTVWHACVVWFRYNPTGVERPGLYQSPYGHSRFWTLALVAAVLISAMLPLCHYFPVYMTSVPGMPWVEVGAASAFRRPSKLLDFAGTGKHVVPSFQEKLTIAEKAYRDRLREHSWRWAQTYDDQKREFAKHTPFLKDRQASHEFLNAAPENWIGVAITGVATGDRRFAYALAVAYLLCVSVPLLLIAGVVFGVLGSILPLLYVRIATEYQQEDTDLYYFYRRLAESECEVTLC